MNNELKKIEREKNKAASQNKWREAADSCNYIGSELFRVGEFEEALQFHSEELSYNEMIGDKLGLAVANRKLGECCAELGKYKKALMHIHTFLELAVSIGNKVEEQRAFATLGRTYYLQYIDVRESEGNTPSSRDILDRAQRSYIKALELSDSVNASITPKEYAEMRARCFLNLGLVYDNRGDLTQCAENIRHAIFLATKHNLYEDLNRCQSSLATVYQKRQQYMHALRLMDGAISTAEKLHNKALLCEELFAKGGVLIDLKDFEGARCCLKRAYKLRSPVQVDHDRIAKYLKACIFLCTCQKKLQEAESWDIEGRKAILEKIADRLSSLEHANLALEYYFLTLECIENRNYPPIQIAPIYFSIAMTYQDLEDKESALRYLKKELECYEGQAEEQVKSLLKIAEILEDLEDLEELEDTLLQSVQLAQRMDNRKVEKIVLWKLLDFYQQNRNSEKGAEIKSRLDAEAFADLSSDMSEEEDEAHIQDDDINLSDVSDLKDSGSDTESDSVHRSRKRTKKPVLKLNEKGETPLHQACINGNLTIVRRLIESGHPVDARDFCGWLPLHEACNHGFYDIVDYLLDKGAAINDRGGPGCEGITPLHDAAACGHLEVMRLLMERGASVTVLDDNGQTPLQTLQDWRKHMEDDLDQGTIVLCRSVENELKEKMSQAGQAVEEDTPEDIPPLPSDLDARRLSSSQDRLSEKRGRSSSSSDEMDDEDIQCFTPYLDNNDRNDLYEPGRAQSEYQSAMSKMRQSALSGPSTSKTTPQQPKTSTQRALVHQEEVVNDWLIKDTNQNQAVKKRRRKAPRLNIRTSKSMYNYVTPNEPSAVSDDIEDFIIDDVVPPSSPREPESLPALPPAAIETVHKTETARIFFKLKVKIMDSTILVPVSEDSATVGWLAEQAAQRYEQIVGKRPHLTLMTKDGCLLASTDELGVIFSNNDEVSSLVKSWEEPNPEECYTRLCNQKHVAPLTAIKNLLSDITSSYQLKLSYSLIPSKHMSLIFSCLSSCRTLQTLDINGNSLGDSGALDIINAFPFLVSLTSLNISMCCLTSETLKNIAEFLNQQTNVNQKLPKLKALNLSHNFFFTVCSSYVCAILQLPSLASLNLSSSNLPTNFFEDDQLCQTLGNCQSLTEFDISSNRLSEASLRNYSVYLPKDHLKNLDISYTTEPGYNFEIFFQGFLDSAIPQLCEIQLNSCYLVDNDLTHLVNSLPNYRKLTFISLSANPDLTGPAVSRFVDGVFTFKPTIKLNLTGTFSNSIDSMTELKDLPENSRLLDIWSKHFGNNGPSSLLTGLCKISLC